jgi:hypothetical protein
MEANIARIKYILKFLLPAFRYRAKTTNSVAFSPQANYTDIKKPQSAQLAPTFAGTVCTSAHQIRESRFSIPEPHFFV